MSDLDLNFPRAFGVPCAHGVIREKDTDFFVEEILPVSPTGTGTHCWLFLDNCGDNTAWIARTLAEVAGVERSAVSYCGLKDRHAWTRQWFSVDIAGKVMPDWRGLPASMAPLTVVRSARKLRRGIHRANHFRIVVRDLHGDPEALERKVASVCQRGVPNYFGEQRFGHQLANLELADAILIRQKRIRDRHRRSLALSSARSWIFNKVLAHRVRDSTWDRRLVGEWCIGAGVPTGPLWGAGDSRCDGIPLALERMCALEHADWLPGLDRLGLKLERRALISRPQNLTFEWVDDRLVIDFSLRRGEFATSVLREIVDYRNAAFERLPSGEVAPAMPDNGGVDDNI
jgi:tRNA pseudouridine13 synthase